MSPKEKPAPEWRREAGGYRSADDRFTIVSEGSGRWFVRDAAEHDELGQPRTTGPFASLAEAKTTAAEQRGQPAEESPLAKRLAEARSRPRRRPARGGAQGRPTRSKPPTSPPKPRTWIERLADDDPALARRARAVVAALETVGVPGEAAEGVVRRERDILLKEP